MDQLIRETQPPAGTPPSPVPQYYNPNTGTYERVEGEDGATKVTLPPTVLSTLTDILNKLSGDPATETTLAQVLAALQGTLDVSGDVEVAGEVDIGDRPNRELGKVTVAGSTVDRRGPASARPPASSVDVGTTYWSVDTGDVSVSTGSTWRSLGVA